jgi:formylglycine-generating enzyme required for sulfatase activity
LSKRRDEKKAKRTYRLPSEAEWEYACRAGSASTAAFHYGPTLTAAESNINSDPADHDPPGPEPLRRTCLVGQYAPNAFGLYDMHGNVWEWCLDWYDDTHYNERAPRDPRGPRSGLTRVIRGGSWGARWMHSRAARRHHCAPRDRIYGFGFRVAMTVG